MLAPSLLSLLLLAAPAPRATAEEGADRFASARKAMLEDQLEARGIRDRRVLDAMARVPRHEFVPEAYRERAYDDSPLPIGEGQTISQPFVVAYMVEQLELAGDETVLEIGTGSGYQTAVLAQLAKHVFSIEIVSSLAARARADLERLGVLGVAVRTGDGYKGWPEKAPFDAIIVSAAPDHVPQPLVDQLAEGGRMILPVGDRFQELVLLTRDAAGVREKRLLGVRFVPMTGEAQK